jgi:localization factor PodJL
MTTESDLSAGAPGQRPQKAQKKAARPSQPSTVQINMPKQGQRRGGPAQPQTQSTSMENVEGMLGKLMNRLDESDQRYSSALDDLNSRLIGLSKKAHNVRPTLPDNSGAALDRVREQASSLAAQVNEASTQHRSQRTNPAPDLEQRMGGFPSANDDGPDPYFGDNRLSGDFADVTERLERSLEEHAPAGDFDALAHRMDDLAHRFDSALATKNDTAALQSIESQLNVLTAGFNDARQNYARVETIEGHLVSLMNWAQSTGSPVNGTDNNERLNAIEQSLHALNENARDEQPEQESMPNAPASATDQLGATIPDYQPAPDKPRGRVKPKRQAPPQNRVEPTFEPENDFIASARRAAAAAAAQEPAPRQKKPTRRSKKSIMSMVANAYPSTGKKSRSLLVYSAVSLMIVGAGLLYTRIKSSSPTPVSGTSLKVPPQSTLLPNKAPENAAPIKPTPKVQVDPKQQSEHMGVMPAKPARAESPAPVVAPPQKSAAAIIPASQPLSTSTLLASLPPNAGQQLMSGITTEIKEPTALTPRALNAPRSASPALVPPAPSAPRQALMPLPKRIPAQEAAPKPSPANTGPVDSARANEVTPAASSKQTSMPPALIGPYSLRNAAARGNPAAQVEIASRYAKGTGVSKNLKKAAEWYHRAAAQGFAPGQYRLAALYERGQGVKKDDGMARTWYRRAAELGNVRAMHNLAVLYTRNKTRGPDYASAKNWFQEAARRGLADSQFNLGILYESGLGARKNTAEAYKWFTLAARQGDAEAGKRREALRTRIPAKSLAAAEKIIRSWKPASVKDEANKSGPPRGGWHNAKFNKGLNAGDPALIARAQFLLNKVGYDAGVPDGKLGPQTITAIRKFEGRQGISQTGKVSQSLLKRLSAISS